MDALELSNGEGLDQRLRRLTDARVRLGRSGAGLPTKAVQSFLLDHARARAAVWSELDTNRLKQELVHLQVPILSLRSDAGDRATYVRRPDLGRRLSRDSLDILPRHASRYDVALVIGDGLSATAVDVNAGPTATALFPKLLKQGLTVAPVVLVKNARVAVGDWIAEALGARIVVMLIGERPGLSAADSLGAYVTYNATKGTPDSRRNCISNIREGGLPVAQAASALANLISRMADRKISGVMLESEGALPSV
ncbi:MAG: ethanolamine ammonia-lyase subunit EutC [Proteobacteria bacterium]|nr:ethanolamine ammonia-lyase subunit EutC [Pseudomonadota bacterium]